MSMTTMPTAGDGGATNSSGAPPPGGFAPTPDFIYASGVAPTLCLTNSVRACPNFPSFRFYVPGFAAFTAVLSVFGLVLLVARLVLSALRDRRAARLVGKVNIEPSVVVLNLAILFGVLQAGFHAVSFAVQFDERGGMLFMTLSSIAYLLGYAGFTLYLHHLLAPAALWSPRVRTLRRFLPATIILPVAQVPVRIYSGILTDASLTSPPSDAATARIAAVAVAVFALYNASLGPFAAIVAIARTAMVKSLKAILGPETAAAALKGPVGPTDRAVVVSEPRKFESDPRQQLYELYEQQQLLQQQQWQGFNEFPKFRDQQLQYQSPPHRSPFVTPPRRQSSSSASPQASQYSSSGATYYTPTPPPARDSRFGDDPRRPRRPLSAPLAAVSRDRVHVEGQARAGSVAATVRILDFFNVAGAVLAVIGIVASVLSALYSAKLDTVFLAEAVTIWGVLSMGSSKLIHIAFTPFPSLATPSFASSTFPMAPPPTDMENASIEFSYALVSLHPCNSIPPLLLHSPPSAGGTSAGLC
ncbi:hypothetical protein DFJ73DRAFT_917847 [Zopfochytrium polystomum]|nr:hypothetical protein DFJ73DRAFT_917847 [Zopfochytrium polystomum]